MDKIILTTKDVETVLQWRDQNIELVRMNAAPFKAIILDFPETKINIKTIRDGKEITFYISIQGQRAGKIKGLQMLGGFYNLIKNTTKLNSEDIQSILTVYSSLMALIVYHEPVPAAPAATKQPRNNKASHKAKQQRNKSGLTYILKSGSRGVQLVRRGGHASPAGVFSVRGHYRQYKDGRRVWIKPYKKGTGKEKNKTYKL